MAISSSVTSGPFTGTGAQAAFPFSITVAAADELQVTVNGAVVSPTLYTVALVSTGSGTVTFSTPPAVGAQILIISNPDFTQETMFENEGAYNLSTVNNINRRDGIRAAWLKDATDRALKVPLGETAPDVASLADANGSVLGIVGNRIVPVPNNAVSGVEAVAAAQTATSKAAIATAQAAIALAAAAAAKVIGAVLNSPLTAGGSLPFQVVSIAGGVGTGTGGVPGTYALRVTGGPSGFQAFVNIGNDGKIASYDVKNPGIAISNAAPTLSLAGVTGLTGATTPTATMGTIPVDRQVLASTADGQYVALWTNTAGAVTPVNGAGGSQIVFKVSTTSTVTYDVVTWNPADKASKFTLSEGNATALATATGWAIARATQSRPASESRYFEATLHASSTNPLTGIGLANATANLNDYTGSDNNSIGYIGSGNVYLGGSLVTTLASVADGETVGVLCRAGKVWFRTSAGWQNGDPAADTGGQSIASLGATVYPTMTDVQGAGYGFTLNGGTSAFAYTLPTGAQAWNVGAVTSGDMGDGGTGGTGTPPLTTGYVCDGDSITFGLYAATPYPTRLAAITGLSAINMGISGQTLQHMDAEFASRGLPAQYNAATNNTLVLLGGINDIRYNPTTITLSQLQGWVTSYATKALAAGYRLVLATLLPSTDVTGGADTVRRQYNAWLIESYTALGAIGLADFAGIHHMTEATDNSLFYVDGLHPDDPGDALMAREVAAVTLRVA